MASDPNWDAKTIEQKLDFLKLWAENLQGHIRNLDHTVQRILEELRQVGAIPKDDRSGDEPRA
jgi:hypothetical protein